ncbi:prenyltransferase/squalene oxidase repeat-containing protein [Streptomyces sp. SR27]|uniref:terpene synthase family protein n=1 Tax=Streptomyces sp. SR27 TaxID=3076630 RepID=UPI00295C036C|nr:prenyltransferase/squalene oxidase repeat-containing protein [Streptomyces sp. SR27]MDV9187002.1 prenyltransferase/squalene oxidase repeat-containing protein [Streptomyces sp. SR27]
MAEDSAVRRLARMGHGRMAGLVAPGAAPGDLELLACWGAFITLVDDGFDRPGGVSSAAEARAVLDPLVAVVTGEGTAVRTPAVVALRDLWQRTTVGTEPAWCERFATAYASFAEATCQELRWREEGYTPSVEEYVRLRRLTITVTPLLLVALRPLWTPSATEELYGVCADVVAWTNDLFDAGSERPGQVGLVDVLARERSIGRGEAAAVARAMLEESLDGFDTATGPVRDDGSRRWAELIRTFLGGAVAWQYETRRYRVTLPSQRGTAGPQTDPLEAATGALERRLALAVAPGGALPDRCVSRVLETALLLALLRTRGSHEHEQRQLTRYLDERRPAADPLDALLIDACLRPHTLPADAADATRPLTGGLSRATGSRGRFKRSVLHAVLHVLGGLRLDAADAPTPAATPALSTFTLVNQLAVRAVYAQATGHQHALSTRERFQFSDLLADAGGRLLWEASASTHLLGLNALQSFRPGHRLIDDAVTGLLLTCDVDGGVPFLDSQDLWLSAVGGLAFLDRPALRPYTARMGAFVASHQAHDGGWPFASGVRQTDVDSTCRAMEFLQTLDPHRYRHHLRRGAAYLAAIAGSDGGFPTWLESDHPDLDMTAGAVLALAPFGQDHHRLVTAAIRFVLDAQLPDGSFTPSWTLSESSVILRAVDALDAARTLPAADLARIDGAIARAAARLIVTQQPDGGWGHTPDSHSDPLSTAQALTVVSRYGPPHVTAAAGAHLLSRQSEDGCFPSPPDQVGPRPLPFDYPVVADIHALTALDRISGAPLET